MNNIVTIVAAKNFTIESFITNKILEILDLPQNSKEILKLNQAYDFKTKGITKEQEQAIIHF